MATGWGRSTWGDDKWGVTSAIFGVTGVAGTSALGAETVTADANVGVTQSTLTSTLGNAITAGAAV
ncbi:MAG: hypothetical protein CL867_08175, partial [Cytophagaceae bacterium]|nr:hypothetical protein [Cytophagaceae bacterium]